MSDPAPPPAPTVGEPARPWWGLGDVAVGWLLAQVVAMVLGAALLAAFGYSGKKATIEHLPLSMIALTYPVLWVGFLGVPWWAARTKGFGWVRDFRIAIARWDVPLGLVVGAVTQLVIVPLVSLPFLWLSHTSLDDLGKPARELGDKATSTPMVVLFFLVVAIGAPIAEEIFFRGLTLRAAEKRFGTVWGVVVSSVLFGITHRQTIQLPALIVAGAIFAYLAVRFDRLGPAIAAHVGFNAVTVIAVVNS